MNVLIKGMDMPKGCLGCPFKDVGMNTMTRCMLVAGWVKYENDGYGIPSACPLVGVPTPHGKLIDADELIRIAEKWIDHPDPYISQRNKDFIYFLKTADAVIEAEE